MPIYIFKLFSYFYNIILCKYGIRDKSGIYQVKLSRYLIS